MASIQHFVPPWRTAIWDTVREKLATPATNFVEFDAMMAALQTKKPRSRLYQDLFGIYYSSEQTCDKISAEELFSSVIPSMCQHVLAAPRLFKGVKLRLLTSGQLSNITLTQPQVYSLLCCIWFGLIDYDYLETGPARIENFSELTFAHAIAADNIVVLSFLLRYFAIKPDPSRIIILQRFSVKSTSRIDQCNLPVIEPAIGIGNYDDTYAPMQLVSCHRAFGGGMFKSALTQEEIIYLVRPECMMVPLLCEHIGDRESILVYGAEKYSQYKGSGTSVQSYNHKDTTSVGNSGTARMLKSCIAFANPTDKSSAYDQLITDFDRDIIKAYVGMAGYPSKCSIASANWTYGFNGANIQGKFIQLLIAASLAGKTLEYYPVGDFEKMLLPFIDWLQSERPTISTLYKIYRGVVASHNRYADMMVFQLMMEYDDLKG